MQAPWWQFLIRITVLEFQKHVSVASCAADLAGAFDLCVRCSGNAAAADVLAYLRFSLCETPDGLCGL